MKDELARADALFADRKVDEAMNTIGGLLERAEGNPAERDQLMAWIVERVGGEHPQVSAHIALAGGALVEGGASATAIGRAIVAPVVRALRDAARMIGYAKEHGHAHSHDADADAHSDEHDDSPAAHDRSSGGPEHRSADHEHSSADHQHRSADHQHSSDHDHDHVGDDVHEHVHDHGDDQDHDHDDDDHDHAVEIFGFALGEDDLKAIAAKDVAAVRAWFSLEMWYRPAVACWTRDLTVLREVQANQELRDAIGVLGHESPTPHWLSVLIETLADAPMIVLVPELGEAWSFTADGVVDMGQLTVLASKYLAEPLRRIGASGVATKAELAVMSGEAEQSGEGGYSSSFAFYPIEASDPTDGLPRDGIVMWAAPGGTGSHSLPGDFLPGTLPSIDGVRVLVMVGPKAPGLRFVRIIQSARMFDALRAEIRGVKKLPDPQAAQLLQLARDHGRRVRAS
ncbi:MAG: hypothetical protein H0T46_16315 [Deltaproteobacteria bacterium]|nr:hypothetical protein [Deltaproteobacteria bacterium]